MVSGRPIRQARTLRYEDIDCEGRAQGEDDIEVDGDGVGKDLVVKVLREQEEGRKIAGGRLVPPEEVLLDEVDPVRGWRE